MNPKTMRPVESGFQPGFKVQLLVIFKSSYVNPTSNEVALPRLSFKTLPIVFWT